jgi:hypothetical protein
MNGVGGRKAFGYDGGTRLGPGRDPAPAARNLADGYRKDILSGFESDKPRYNPVSLRDG